MKGGFYNTMNLEKSVNETLRKLDLKTSIKTREYPWKKHSNPKRTGETV